MPTLTLTNGAANWAYSLLNESKCKMSDLFASGSLARAFKPAASMPDRDKTVPVEEFIRSVDAQREYKQSVDLWLDSPFNEGAGLEVSQTEFEYMRGLLKKLGEKESLPGVYHVADLCRAFELDKP